MVCSPSNTHWAMKWLLNNIQHQINFNWTKLSFAILSTQHEVVWVKLNYKITQLQNNAHNMEIKINDICTLVSKIKVKSPWVIYLANSACTWANPYTCINPWWRHQMGTFSALLALTKLQSYAWINGWVNNREAGEYETPSHSLWRHCKTILSYLLMTRPSSNDAILSHLPSTKMCDWCDRFNKN